MDYIKLAKLRKAESIVHNKKLYRNYDKCQFDSLLGFDLAHVVLALIKASIDYKELFYVVFNDTVFYSDTVSLNSAYNQYFDNPTEILLERREYPTLMCYQQNISLDEPKDTITKW